LVVDKNLKVLIEFIIFLSKKKIILLVEEILFILLVEEFFLKTMVIRRVKEKCFFTYIRND